jgi:hypothetical protein
MKHEIGLFKSKNYWCEILKPNWKQRWMAFKITMKFNRVKKQANTFPSLEKHNNHNKSRAMVVKPQVVDNKYLV